ncbi:probable serine/threonine-protein kinase At1g01540 isoform X2 [Benincasa hispida]|uniref:probable serine/threonine-protein kinase At1g01540 isoform X2 n=1 Tax=Benincasa hispida TaxID=102211 RepID=UPI0018FFEB92|nr:probable serine/threonine-protein kinase At1g01540 isoform X2 [Benincasa hispida]
MKILTSFPNPSASKTPSPSSSKPSRTPYSISLILFHTMPFNSSFVPLWLSSRTALGVKRWVLILTSVFVFLLFAFILAFIFHVSCRGRRRNRNRRNDDREAAISAEVLPEMDMKVKKGSDHQFSRQGSLTTQHSIVTDWEYSAGRYSPAAFTDRRRWSTFALEEIALATNGFSEENTISIEDFSVDYYGNLADDTKVIVKIFNANNSFGDNEFIREAERIRHISHKNLVNLLGYCTQGIANNRMFVYENLDNGNLHQWLHGCSQKPFSPLTWSIRMNIIQGIAKGLAYLHEDVEPQILHGRLKSSCILLDQHWNPKIANFGLVELLLLEYSPGSLVGETYESLENGSISPFTDQKNDVYSFGILLMEMITGRAPVESNQSQPDLTEWVKSMIGNQQAFETVDSKLEEKPASKQLKRMLLIALRCVDPDIQHRPTMGQILLMLQPHDLLLSDGRHIGMSEFL